MTGGASVDAGGERASVVQRVNIIDGVDDRGALAELGPALGLSGNEIARIRKVSGYVGCLSPSPSMGAGALFVSNGQILTAAHILFEPSGRPRRKCFFRNQDPEPFHTELDLAPTAVRFGAKLPKAGSAADFAVVRLVEPVPRAVPFQSLGTLPGVGDALIVVTAHPAGMARQVDNAMPVVQGCTVRRVLPAKSPGAASQFRTDCDATGSSSGGMNLSRVGGELVFQGITISTGPWRNKRLVGAPYDEKAGSATTALSTAGAVQEAGRSLAGAAP